MKLFPSKAFPGFWAGKAGKLVLSSRPARTNFWDAVPIPKWSVRGCRKQTASVKIYIFLTEKCAYIRK